MKKVFSLVMVAGMLSMMSCGGNQEAEETQTEMNEAMDQAVEEAPVEEVAPVEADTTAPAVEEAGHDHAEGESH